MNNNDLFTSESGSEGHPDEIADQVSDAVLDAILAQDRRARVAVKTLVKSGMVLIAGEVTTSVGVELEALVRRTVLRVGYDRSELGFDGASCETSCTGKVSREYLTRLVRAHFDLTPYGLRQMLDPVRPIYAKTAACGHFGREEPEFTWEVFDRATLLGDAAGLASATRAAKKRAAATA